MESISINRLNKCSQPALKNVVSYVRETVNSAGNDDQQKCADLVSQVEQRVACLNMLRPYSGKLTRKGKEKFDALLLEIGNPREFHPEYWKREIPKLNQFLSGRRGSNNTELSPVNEDENDNGSIQGTTDSPNELTEI